MNSKAPEAVVPDSANHLRILYRSSWMIALSLVIFFAIASPAHAATRTIANGGGNYNSTSTWVEGAVPTSADDVVATVTSGQLTVNVASAAKSVDFTNYTNTLTMNAALTVSGNVTLVSAMTIAGSSALIVNTTATLTSNGKTWPNALTLQDTVGITYTLADNWTVSGTVKIGFDGHVTNTPTIVNGSTLFMSGSLTMAADAGVQGTTNFVLNGTGTWSCSNFVDPLRNNLTINTAGTITISGSVYYSTGTFTYTAGTVVTTGSTMVIQSGITLPSGITWNNLTFSGLTTTYTLSADTTVNGNFSAGGHSNGNTTINGFTMYVGGNLNMTGDTTAGSVNGTTNIVLNGTGSWTSANSIGQWPLKNNVTINTAGTITIPGTIGYNTGTLRYVAGTVVTTNSTLIVAASTALNTNGISWNNITLSGTSTDTLSSNLTVNGTMTVSGNTTFAGSGQLVFGSSSTLAGSSAMTIPTSFTLASGMTNSYTGAMTFTATGGTKTITTNGLTLASNLTFNGVGGTWQLADNLTDGSTKTISVTNGTLDANGKNVTVGSFSSSNTNTRSILMGSGTWTLTGNAGTIWTTATSSGLTLVRGNAIVSNYSGSTGTRTIIGSSTEAASPDFSITGGTDTIALTGGVRNLDFTGFAGPLSNGTRTVYGNLTVGSGTSVATDTSGFLLGGTTQTFSGSTTFNILTKTFGTLIIAAGSNLTVNTLTLSNLTLRSSLSGHPFNLNAIANNASITGVILSDANNTSQSILECSGCTNNGGNSRWNFTTPVTSNSPSATVSGSSGGGGGGSRYIPAETSSSATSVKSSSSSSSRSVRTSGGSISSRSAASSPTPTPNPSSQPSSLSTILRNTNLRKNPWQTSFLITTLLADWKVSIQSINGLWAKVRTLGGKEGYVLKSNVSASAPLNSQVTSAPIGSRITTVPLRVHSDTSMQAKTIAQLPRNLTVLLLDVIDAWARIRLPDGREGFVIRQYLRK